MRTPRILAPLIVSAALIGLAGCGLRVNAMRDSATTVTANSDASGTTSTTSTTSTSSTNTPSAAAPTITTPLPALGPRPGPGATTPVTAAENTPDQLHAVYDTFLADISGLDDNLNQSWATSLQQVVTPRLLNAAEKQAETFLRAHEHGTGVIKDAHRVVKITGPTTASIFDCLDEVDWYLVEDASGQPDPGITRGDFVGIADLVLQDGRWYVDVWQSSQGQCRF
jgi:hypothetical protein